MANFLVIVAADADQKLPLLLNSLGRDGLDVYDGLPEPKETYEKAIERFDAHFECRQSILLKRKAFFNARQGANESSTDFACRLRRLVRECGFDSAQLTLLRDIFVCGVYDDRLGERLLAEDASTLTFETALAKAEAFERARADRRTAVPSIATVTKPRPVQHSSGSTPKPTDSRSRCYRCNSGQHRANYPQCPAKNAVCHNCQRKGHFKSVCKSSSHSHPHSNSTIAQIDVENTDDTTHYKLFSSHSRSRPNCTREVVINDQQVSILIDTGAEVNVLPRDCVHGIDIQPTMTSIKAWGNFPIPVLGTTYVSVRYKSVTVRAFFHVVDLPSSAVTPLFSFELCKDLGLMAELACLGPSNPIENSSTDGVLSKFQDLFERHGSLQTGYEYSVTLKDDAIPFSPPARRLPPSLHDKVKAELDKMEEAGIIKKVTEPTPYCAPMVVAYKKSGDIRICADFRKLNESVEREHFQIPTFDELTMKVANPKFFSQLDCRSSFHQIPVSAESQSFLSFSTPFGRYAYMKLPFGISTAPEVFSRCMYSILEGIPNILIYIDDLIIWGSTQEEHDKTLETVLQRLDTAGLALNKDKCKFSVQSVSFLGHVWSTDGIHPCPTKIAAIASMPLPDSLTSLRTFLGLATYVGQRYVPHFSSLMAPLWEMLKTSDIEWNAHLVQVFEKVRSEITKVNCRSYLDPTKKIVVQTDASGIGVGAVVIQEGAYVSFASRALTPVEKRYSQIEREFLAIVFALKRFSSMLIGQTFEIQTDHAPLLRILRKPLDSVSNRMQRWIVAIQHFSFQVSHIKGSENVVADALSRNPISLDPTPEEVAEHTLCFALKSLALDLSQIALESSRDPLLTKLSEAVQQDWPADAKRLQPFYAFRDEISFKEGRNPREFILMKGDVIILPESLRKTFLQMSHEGHSGVSKTKAVLRTLVYWPGMGREIEDYVRNCVPCRTFSTRGDSPPLTVVARKKQEPWETVAIDLTGPSDLLQGCTLLTTIDLHSGYPEAHILSQANSKNIIDALTITFAKFGLPKTILSDNGTPFVSAEFDSFLSLNGMKHVRSSNFNPRGNGAIERLHYSLKNRLKKILYETPELPLWKAIQKVLYDLRSSPHDMTGETPFYRLFGRPMPTRLSRIVQNDTSSPSSRTRCAESEYRKHWHTSRSYKPGDQVLVRKGDKQPFLQKGVIEKQVAQYTYKVDLGNHTRVYNQRHLKSLAPETHTHTYFEDYQTADEAYDSTNPPEAPPESSSANQPSRRSARTRKPVDRFGVSAY